MDIPTAILISACVASVIIAMIVTIIPRRVKTITEVVNVVEHDYKMSKDYGRLYDLLEDGRKVIVLVNGYPRKGELFKTYDGEKNYWGLGSTDKLKDCTKERFVSYCEFMEISYLDQIDKYLTIEDYMKK